MENKDKEIEMRIKNRLKKINIDYDQLTERQMDYLARIEIVVQNVFEKEKKAISLMAGNHISKKGIAEATGIGRATINRDNCLQKYIEVCQDEFKQIDVTADRSKDRDTISKLQNELHQLHVRDVDFMENKRHLSDAFEEIERLKQRVFLQEKGIFFDFSGKKEKTNIISFNPTMRLISWNVNGLPSCAENGFFNEFVKWNADIVCVQETKVKEERVNVIIPGYYQYWNFSQDSGYSGTAIFSKEQPINVYNGFGIPEFDREGRLITAEFKDFFILCIYSPTSQEGLIRLPYRLKWEEALRKHASYLMAIKPVILCGDMNVAFDAEVFLGKMAGTSNEERIAFEKLTDLGLVDAFQYCYTDTSHIYSWWSYADNCRDNNIGLRLDYFLIDSRLRNKLIDVQYLTETVGSDHCPVSMTIQI